MSELQGELKRVKEELAMWQARATGGRRPAVASQKTGEDHERYGRVELPLSFKSCRRATRDRAGESAAHSSG